MFVKQSMKSLAGIAILASITIVALDLVGRGMQRLRGSSASATAELEGRA